MNKDKLIHLLRDSGYLTPSVSLIVADHFKETHISKNQFQLKSGKICDEYLFLEEGYMRAFAYDTDGNEVTIGFYAPGNVLF